MQRIAASIILFSCCASALAAWSGPIKDAIWQLPSSAIGARWLVVHNLASAENDGVYHVEVLERKFGAEKWNIKHVANHLALTPTALRASIIKPLKRGAVYPESFDNGYAQWKKQQSQGEASICSTTVMECLK